MNGASWSLDSISSGLSQRFPVKDGEDCNLRLNAHCLPPQTQPPTLPFCSRIVSLFRRNIQYHSQDAAADAHSRGRPSTAVIRSAETEGKVHSLLWYRFATSSYSSGFKLSVLVDYPDMKKIAAPMLCSELKTDSTQSGVHKSWKPSACFVSAGDIQSLVHLDPNDETLEFQLLHSIERFLVHVEGDWIMKRMDDSPALFYAACVIPSSASCGGALGGAAGASISENHLVMCSDRGWFAPSLPLLSFHELPVASALCFDAPSQELLLYDGLCIRSYGMDLNQGTLQCLRKTTDLSKHHVSKMVSHHHRLWILNGKGELWTFSLVSQVGSENGGEMRRVVVGDASSPITFTDVSLMDGTVVASGVGAFVLWNASQWDSTAAQVIDCPGKWTAFSLYSTSPMTMLALDADSRTIHRLFLFCASHGKAHCLGHTECISLAQSSMRQNMSIVARFPDAYVAIPSVSILRISHPARPPIPTQLLSHLPLLNRVPSFQSGLAQTAFDADPVLHVVHCLGLSLEHRSSVARLTIAGKEGQSGYVDGPLGAARFHTPCSAVWDAHRNVVYVADTGNHAVRGIDLESQRVWTVVGGRGWDIEQDGRVLEASLWAPFRLQLVDRRLWIQTLSQGVARYIDIDDGIVSTVYLL
eukprot:ANDGO_04992.mRNA.1 hypothetical protein